MRKSRVVVALLAACVLAHPGARGEVLDVARVTAGQAMDTVAAWDGGGTERTITLPLPAPGETSVTVPLTEAPAAGTSSSVAAGAVPAPSAGPAGDPSSHAFTRRDAHGPARWNPCAPVPILVNLANAPAGAEADLREAAARISSASGMDLRVVGTTDATPKDGWATRQYGNTDGWAPVLVAFGPAGTGALTKGSYATTQPALVKNSAGQRVIVSASLIVNTEIPLPAGFGPRTQGALLMHELGHVLGLDHVQDTTQLMHPNLGNADDLEAGDIEGLRQVGSGGCVQVPAPSWGDR